jgi:hypothetical protein
MATSRWWDYQLVEVNERGKTTLKLKEIFWKQEGNKMPSIWYHNDAIIAGETPEIIAQTLRNIVQTIKASNVLTESMLPSKTTMKKEYMRFLAEKKR